MGSNNIPSSNATNVFLGDAINIATRSVHARLNKLILLRLPLAIPPRADGPSAYTQGILHIAPLYISFESLWHAALHAHESNPEDSPTQPSESVSRPSSPRPFPFRSRSTSNNSDPSQGPRPSRRIYTILNQLFIPGLLRSARLRSDLRSLTGWSDAVLQSRLEEVATSGRLGEIVSHIRRSAEKRSHVLLAYAWVLYMALFSGGRFIRATLESAGARGFWTAGGEKRTAPVHGPLDFFHFPTPQDGEDLKHEFKQRLVDLGGLLTEGEREHIVREAICIFENLILVINQLDDVCHTKLEDLNSVDASVMSPRSAGFRIRDSVIVTRERSYRAAQRSQPEEPASEPGSDPKESSSRSTTSPSGSESEGESKPQPQPPKMDRQDVPKLDRHPSCHTVQVASASPRVEKEDPFSRKMGGRTRSESSNMDPDLAERLARAMRFDPRLPVPERTPSATEVTKPESLKDGGADGTETPEPRTRSDSTMARGIQVASALGLAVAVAVAWSRG
jgi:heme oxygenase